MAKKKVQLSTGRKAGSMKRASVLNVVKRDHGAALATHEREDACPSSADDEGGGYATSTVPLTPHLPCTSGMSYIKPWRVLQVRKGLWGRGLSDALPSRSTGGRARGAWR
jgi:hypothetical protein